VRPARISPRIADLNSREGATRTICSIALCSKFRESYVMQDRAETRRTRDRPVDEDAGFTARPVRRAAVTSALSSRLGRAGFKPLVKPSFVWGRARLNKDTVTRPNYKPAAAQSAALKEDRWRRKWDWRLRSPAMQRRRCPTKPPPLAEAKSEAAGCLTSKGYCPESAFLRIAGRAFASRWRGTAHVRANARRPGFDAARSIYRASCGHATLSWRR